MARKYNKNPDNPYWEKRKEGVLKSAIEVAMNNPARRTTVIREMPTITYEFGGEAQAGYTTASTQYRDGFAPSIESNIPFKNIAGGMLPWESSNGYISIATAMLLMQRAYANIPIYRNAVESAVEFSNSPLHVKTDNQTVKDFFISWFDRIGIYKLKSMYFRNHYREGNDFIYKFMGKMEESKYAQMKSVFGAKSPYIPIRYTLLNPTQVYLTSGVVSSNNYVKMLSQYEILRLRDPKTPEDKQVFNSLPADVKKAIMKGNASQVFIPLDPSRLICTFYKKQDFEPMAIPMGYPLLPDFEWKLELQKRDQSLLATLEQVLLVVTNGEAAQEWGGGGINPQNIANLQAIFRNQTLGRVLVADYTTKVDWKIPDIAKILGPEKYIQAEKNIREGLQSVFVGDDKFANASMKAKIYSERMKEGQKAFLNEFLIPEVKFICEAMGFRDVPEIEFEQINLDDTSQRERVILRLAEIGILTPDEVFTALESGVLPEKKTNLQNQEEYKKARDKELYMPLIGGPKQDGGDGRPGGSGIKKTAKKVGKIGTTKAEALASLSVQADHLLDDIKTRFKKARKAKILTDEMESIASELAQAIMANEEPKDWTKKLDTYIANAKEIPSEVLDVIEETAIEYDVSRWIAILIYRAGE